MIYIDIGSQTGEEIEQELQNGYEVYAFEPNPKHREFLEKYEDRAKINYAAAWTYDGEVDFYTNEDSPERDVSSTITPENTNNRDIIIKVPCINIGRYLKDLDKDIDVLKIDAEGAEYYIIESILDNFDPKRIKEWRVEDHERYVPSKEWLREKNEILNRLSNLNIKLQVWI